MQCEATIKFIAGDHKVAKATIKALEGLEGELKKRTLSKISIDGKSVLIDLRATDVVALRASVNGYLRQLQAIEAVEKDI